MKKILLLPLLVIFIYGEGKFSGVTYFDYTYDLTKQTGDYNAFDLKRVYFTYQQDISDKISIEINDSAPSVVLVSGVEELSNITLLLNGFILSYSLLPINQ